MEKSIEISTTSMFYKMSLKSVLKHLHFTYAMTVRGLGLRYLTPLSTIFQLYRDDQF